LKSRLDKAAADANPNSQTETSVLKQK